VRLSVLWLAFYSSGYLRFQGTPYFFDGRNLQPDGPPPSSLLNGIAKFHTEPLTDGGVTGRAVVETFGNNPTPTAQILHHWVRNLEAIKSLDVWFLSFSLSKASLNVPFAASFLPVILSRSELRELL
jgi:hypothetical protein